MRNDVLQDNLGPFLKSEVFFFKFEVLKESCRVTWKSDFMRNEITRQGHFGIMKMKRNTKLANFNKIHQFRQI